MKKYGWLIFTLVICISLVACSNLAGKAAGIRTGSLDITSVPKGATIYVDSVNKGVTPKVITGVKVGSHDIKLTKQGYYAYSVSKYVYVGQTAKVAATLRQKAATTGSIRITSQPTNSSIYVDSVYKGVTPKTVTGVSVGSHTVNVTRYGYVNYESSVQVSANQTASVSAVLTPAQLMGQLYIDSYPSNAQIYIDGDYSGTTPITLTLNQGMYYLNVTKSGYRGFGDNPYVYAGQTTDVYANLTPIQTTGSISVTSSPTSALIYLDGVYQGTTPRTLTLVTAGTHSIGMNKTGYAYYQKSTYVTAGQTTTVSGTLTPLPSSGILYVSSTPTSASVYVDNILRGTTPLTLNSVSLGSHFINVTKTGYSMYPASLTVYAGQTATLNAVLQAATTGSLSVTSTPTGASVKVDNQAKGTTPITVSGLSKGLHAVEVTKSGYDTFSMPVNIYAGQTSSISAPLQALPSTGTLQVASNPTNVTVYVDNIYKGVTPLNVTSLAAGNHNVRLTRYAYFEYTTTANVPAGQMAYVYAVMSPIGEGGQ
jgi:hypothetical protein